MVWVNKYHHLRQKWVVLVDLSFGMPNCVLISQGTQHVFCLAPRKT